MKAEIEKALFDATVAFGEVNPSLVFQWPNIGFDQPEDGNFIEVVHTPNTTDNLTWDDDDAGNNQGMFRLLVHYPQGIGTVVPQTTVDLILAAFGKGTTLRNNGVTVKVYRPPWSNGAVKMDDERFIPVVIPYQARKD